MDECHNGELRHLVCGTDEVQEGFSLGVLFDQRETRLLFGQSVSGNTKLW